jgi:group I intron endonuclease
MKRPFRVEPGIYLITNTINNKVWVGQAIGRKGIQGRVTCHLSKFRKGENSPHLQNAWDKYGEDAFTIEPLLYCPIEQCDYWEDYYIMVFKSWDKNKGYNLDRYSRGNGPRTPETIEKTRISNLPHRQRVMAILLSPENRAKATAARKIIVADPVWRKKLSSILTEVYKDPELRRQRKIQAKEVQNRPEVKAKLKEIKTGRVWCNNGQQHKFVRPENVPEALYL